MTIREWMKVLYNKGEHLEITDDFIKGYQQIGGEYIKIAQIDGHPINRYQGEPNQKWHFFFCYITDELLNDKIHLEDDITRIWRGGRLKCPELLLWLAEASGVDEELVRKAAQKMKEIIDEKNDGKRQTQGYARNAAAAEFLRLITVDDIEAACEQSLEK